MPLKKYKRKILVTLSIRTDNPAAIDYCTSHFLKMVSGLSFGGAGTVDNSNQTASYNFEVESAKEAV